MMKSRPSKLIERGQIYFQYGEEITTRGRVPILASDFPHEGIVDMAKAVNAFLDRKDIPEPAKRKVSYDNPKRLYAL